MISPFTRYLVSGGAGFIGRRLVALLANEPNVQVLVVDNFSVGLPPLEEAERVDIARVDVTDTAALDAAVRALGPQVVVHLAAVHHIPTCEHRRAHALAVNVVGTENLLALAEQANVARFVLASSGAVYEWDDGKLHEDRSPIGPSDNYSLSKIANETQVKFWASRTGRHAVIARLFNTIGPGDPNSHLIPDILAQIPSGARRASVRLGNLSPRRDYIHVDDVARALFGLATSVGAAGVDTVNVCTGRDLSVRELVDMIGETIGVIIDVEQDEQRVRRTDRPRQLGAPDKIRQLIGFEPKISMEQAIRDTASAPIRIKQ